ncbi:hypothetical protein ACQSSU_06790 [Micromonospora echinospora]
MSGTNTTTLATPDTTPDRPAYIPLTGPVALLHNAVLGMVGRYGLSCMAQGMAEAGTEEYEKASRAATRQHMALCRLTRALAVTAQGGTR